MACNHCFRGIDAKVKHSYTCARCKANIVARPRYDYNTVTVIPIDYDHIVELIGHYIFFRQKLSLNICDDSGALDATVFGDFSAKFLQVNFTMKHDLILILCDQMFLSNMSFEIKYKRNPFSFI